MTSQLVQLESIYGPLTESVRRLVDATIRTKVDATTLAVVKKQIDCATEELRAALMPGSFGMETADGQPMVWGNVVVGLRNPVAPPW